MKTPFPYAPVVMDFATVAGPATYTFEQGTLLSLAVDAHDSTSQLKIEIAGQASSTLDAGFGWNLPFVGEPYGCRITITSLAGKFNVSVTK